MLWKYFFFGLSIGVVSAASLKLPLETPENVSSQNINPSPETIRLGQFLDKLSLCESNNRPDIKILDTNNEYSFGLYQFQLKTFYTYGKKYGILDSNIELKEAENRIYEPDTQRQIALKMVEDGLQDNWRNCTRIINQQTHGK